MQAGLGRHRRRRNGSESARSDSHHVQPPGPRFGGDSAFAAMSSSPGASLEVDRDGVAVITIRNPPVNALADEGERCFASQAAE